MFDFVIIGGPYLVAESRKAILPCAYRCTVPPDSTISRSYTPCARGGKHSLSKVSEARKLSVFVSEIVTVIVNAESSKAIVISDASVARAASLYPGYRTDIRPDAPVRLTVAGTN